MRVIYFGTLCTFSIAPLRILLEAGCDVAAVIIPTDQSISGHPIVPLSPTNQSPIPLIADGQRTVDHFAGVGAAVAHLSGQPPRRTRNTRNDCRSATRCGLRCLLSQTPARFIVAFAALGLS